MKWIPIFVLFSLASISFFSCIDPPDYPNEPVIEFLSLNKSNVLQSGLDDDTLAITFSFTDGDGDLSFSELSNEQDIFIRDSRDTDSLVTIGLQIPTIPAQGSGNGISACNPFSFPAGATNTMHYTIQIRDKADRFSNIIRTDDIIIQCRE